MEHVFVSVTLKYNIVGLLLHYAAQGGGKISRSMTTGFSKGLKLRKVDYSPVKIEGSVSNNFSAAAIR